MKRKDDFIRAIGPADDDFARNIHQTLTDLQRKEEEKPVKKFSVSFALVMAVLLIAAVAVAAAAQWGVFDFLSGRQNQGPVLPEAAELLQRDIPQTGGETEQATFTLREAVLDGKALYMVVAITPRDAKTMLLGVDAMPTDTMINMGPLFAEENIAIEAWTEQNGKTTMLQTNIYDNAAEEGAMPLVQSMDYVLEADGTLVYMLNGTFEPAEASVDIELICSTMPWVKAADGYTMDEAQRERASLTLTLNTHAVTNTVVSDTPVVYADCGVRVDRVTLTGTAMSTHARVEFTIVDPEAYALTDDGLWFEFLDADGERLPSGSMGTGSIYEAEDGSLVQEDDLAAMETLPETITLRGYNAWEKNRYEAHDITLTPEQ